MMGALMNTIELNHMDHVVATFQPVRTDDLTERGQAAVGWRGEWIVAGTIDEGSYTGQWMMMPFPEDPKKAPPVSWVPLCDLADVELLSWNGDGWG